MSQPEYHSHEEFQNRSLKLSEIKELGIDPYPPKYSPTHSTTSLRTEKNFETIGTSEDAAAGTTPEVTIAGRLVLFRAMGKNAFGQIQDETGRLQVMFNRELTEVTGLARSEEAPITPIKFIEKKLDLGDWIGIKGNLFRTHTGELTLFAKEMTLLSKSLLPLPDKHSGLADKGTRYRKRWLDLIAHPDVMETFRKRSRILHLVRRFLEKAGFMEVETPVLQNLYGGAEARPFTSHLNALDQEMYLRISLEISLKKLAIGGMQKIFEIGKVFRNEGIDRTHNPEFTMIELYGAYLDYHDMMVLTENLFQEIALELHGTTVVSYKTPEGEEFSVDYKAPWKRLSMKGSIKEYGGFDPDKLSDDEMRKKLEETKEFDPKQLATAPRGKLIAYLFETFVEKHLVAPHHIIDHPIETTPLCKPHRDPKLRAEGLVERFESFVLTKEICNSYTELNDPILQRTLLEEQGKKREGGDEEAHPLDEEFLEAICQGMPPLGGLGIGIDRLVMFMTGSPSIRDVLLFPLMRPEA